MTQRVVPVVLLIILLLFGHTEHADAQTFTSDFLARWNLSNGKYLVDIGQYFEALEAFDTAVEMTPGTEVRIDALLQKASVLSLFLDAADDAIGVYDDLVSRYPQSPASEAALFRAGMTLFDAGHCARAVGYFERYVNGYPQGPSRRSAEFLLQQCRAQMAAASTPTLQRQPTPTRPAATATPSLESGAQLAATAPPSAAQSAADVRVRVMKGHGKARVESDDPLILSSGQIVGRELDLVASQGLVRVGGAAGIREVTISAQGPLRIRAGTAARHYRGSLVVRASGNTLLLVNRVGVEDYLYGVVTKESVASWPAEALRTQAIASRTYALYQAERRRDRDYDMVDDEGSQVYGGVEGESAAARRAVDDTRGMIMTYRGRPIYAMFTANTGWHTADPKFIFNQPLPYLNAVPDPYSPREQMGRWTRTHSAKEVRRALSDVLGKPLGPIREIRAALTCTSGRIVRIVIVDDHGAHEMRTRTTLARALKLPEILLDIHHDGDHFVFKGGGFGHGVGLSQWGAKSMATEGFNASDILAFYYRGAHLTRLRP